MKEEYVNYAQAVKLRELGFDWDCEKAYYYHAWMSEPILTLTTIAYKEVENYDGTDIYLAPRLDQAQKWLREIKELIICIEPRFYKGKRPFIGYSYHINEKEK